MSTEKKQVVQEQTATEPICIGFRLEWRQGQASGSDAGVGNEAFSATLQGAAEALDTCVDEDAEGGGSFGSIGFGGVSVTAVFGRPGDDATDEDAESEIIESLSDVQRVCGDLPFGSRSAARRFRRSQASETVWDGHNHVERSTYHTDELLGE